MLEKYCDNSLYDYIRNQSAEEVFEDWLNDCNEMDKVAEFYSENDMNDFDEFQSRYESIDDTMINSLIECFGIETFEKFKEWCLETYDEDIYEYIDDLFTLEEMLQKKDDLIIIMKEEPNETLIKTLNSLVDD